MRIVVLISAYNEEAIILDRITNIRKCSLPEGVQLGILIANDGSNDGTSERIKQIPGVEEINLHRVGKCAALFAAFGHIESDWIVLTDANTEFQENTIVELFRDINAESKESVLLGNFFSLSRGGIARIKPTLPVKRLIEKTFYFTTGANGALYAIKTRVAKRLCNRRACQNDDFIISVFMNDFGRAVFRETAIAIEYEDKSALAEFRRKFRDSRGHLAAMRWVFLNCSAGNAFRVLSVRIFVWILPLVLLTLLLAVGAIVLLAVLMIVMGHRKLRILAFRYAGFLLGVVTGIVSGETKIWNTEHGR